MSKETSGRRSGFSLVNGKDWNTDYSNSEAILLKQLIDLKVWNRDEAKGRLVNC